MSTQTDQDLQARFEKCMAGEIEWFGIDIESAAAILRRKKFFTKKFYRKARLLAEHMLTRACMRRGKDSDGWPLRSSVPDATEEGEVRRVYKEDHQLDADDRRYLINYHAERERHEAEMKSGHQRRAQEQYPDEDWELPLFDQAGD